MDGQVNGEISNVIKWTYGLDADVDHNIFYQTGETPDAYSRELTFTSPTLLSYAAELEGREPDEITIAIVNMKGEEEALAPTDKAAVSKAKVMSGQLTADFTGFKWGNKYKIGFVFQIQEGKILLWDTLNAVDRYREPVVLPTQEYTFDINVKDEATELGYIAQSPVENSYYYWKSGSLTSAVYKAFLEKGIVTEEDFSKASAFTAAELTGFVFMADPSGTADGYIDVDKKKLVLKTLKTLKASELKGELFNSGKQDPEDPYRFVGNEVTRIVTTYTGQQVVLPARLSYRVPEYDFIHQGNFTFNDGSVWYTTASPKYDSNKQSLKSYDASKMNVAKMAFFVIDNKGRFYDYVSAVYESDPDFFYDKNLIVSFDYRGPDPMGEMPLDAQCATGLITTFDDLWSDDTELDAANFKHTVFYYRTVRDAIPMRGTLEVVSGNTRFEIPTSFEAGGQDKYLAKNDYSTFELHPWKPFYVLNYNKDISLTVSASKLYTVNLFRGIQIYDGRQVAASTPVAGDVFKGAEGVYLIDDFNGGVKSYFRPLIGTSASSSVLGWIVGNTKLDGKPVVASDKANGFYDGVSVREAYGLRISGITSDLSGVPQQFRSRINVDTDNCKMTFDNSDGTFSGTAVASFQVEIQSPWYQFQPFVINVTIKE